MKRDGRLAYAAFLGNQSDSEHVDVPTNELSHRPTSVLVSSAHQRVNMRALARPPARGLGGLCSYPGLNAPTVALVLQYANALVHYLTRRSIPHRVLA